jgi:Capsule polysaccharide export protein
MIGVLDYLLLIARHKIMFLIIMVFFIAAGIVYSLSLTKLYRSRAVIFTSKTQTQFPLSSLMSSLPIGDLKNGLNFLEEKNNDLLLSILQSRKMAEMVINRFDLPARYGFLKAKKYFLEDVIKQFSKNVFITEDKYSNISICVTDTSPQTSADMANFMVNELNLRSYELSRENARNSRVFFAERLATIKQALDSVTEQFTQFKMHNNVFDLEQQTKNAINALSELEAQREEIDLKIELNKSQMGTDNPKLHELYQNKSILSKKINEYLENGNGEMLIPLKSVPEKAKHYALLLRDVKFQEAIYQFSLQMWEQAKLKEADNIPVIQILDIAHAPQRRSSPQRSILCILFFFAGLFVSSVCICLYEWYGKQEVSKTDHYYKIQEILMHFFIKPKK